MISKNLDSKTQRKLVRELIKNKMCVSQSEARRLVKTFDDEDKIMDKIKSHKEKGGGL